MAAEVHYENFLVSNSQREFVEKLQRDTPQEALRFALSFVGMKEPRNTSDIVMRQVGKVLSRLKNEQTRLRYVRAYARLLPNRLRRHTGGIERFIGRSKANVCRHSNGKLNGLPTTSAITNRKDLRDFRCEIEAQLEEHAEREAAAAGETEEEAGSGGKRSYGVVRDHDLLMAVFLRSDKLKNLKDKKERLALAQNMCKSAEHVAEAQPAVKRLREEKEDQQKTLPEPVVEAAPGEEEKLRSKKALLRMADFYARVETRVLERVARLEHAYGWGSKEMARRCDRAQQVIRHSVPSTTFTVRKAASCFHLGRIATAVNKQLKKKKPKNEILEDLGGFVPAVVNDAPDADPEADVAADQAGVGAEVEGSKELPGPHCVLGVGLVAYFPRKNSPTWEPYLILNQDLSNYHFHAARLVPPPNQPQARVLTVTDDYLFSNQNDPSSTHDLDRVTIYLAVVPSGGEHEKPRVLVNPDEVVMSRKAVPKGGQAKELPAQNKAVSKYQKRLQELVLLEDYELRAQDGITRKVVGAPPIKRPAADNAVSNGEPPVKRRAESKPPTQELDDAAKKKHMQQKQEQKGKIRRERSVEGFRVTLSGSVSTQRRCGRAYDCVEVKIHDPELKSRFLNLQQGGDVDLICRAKKQPRRFFHFDQDEEEFAEYLALVWAARTRFLLERGRRYARDRSFKSQNTVKEMKSALIEAIRPWYSRCMELAGGDTNKKNQLRQLAKASDDTLARLDPGRVLANVDGPVE